MRPERHLGRHMDESEMTTLASERLAVVRIVHLDLE